MQVGARDEKGVHEVVADADDRVLDEDVQVAKDAEDEEEKLTLQYQDADDVIASLEMNRWMKK